MISVHLILFLAFGAVCVAGAINLLAQTHPINSALSLIAVMAALAGEYLLLGAEFVAAVQVIVYAGAIMVLFVFVIMLLECRSGRAHPGQPRRCFNSASRACCWEAFWWPGFCCGIRERKRSPLAPSRRSQDDRTIAVPRISAAFRNHFHPDSDCHHGCGGAGQQAADIAGGRPGKEGGLMVPLSYYLVLSGFLFACGVTGFLIKRNISPSLCRLSSCSTA